MNDQESIELGFCEGISDKVYRASIEAKDGGFVVNFAYGRRGATLNTGTKTVEPVTYDEASSIYEKLVCSKIVKGYQPNGNVEAGTGTGMIVTDRDQRDTGFNGQIREPSTHIVVIKCLHLFVPA